MVLEWRIFVLLCGSFISLFFAFIFFLNLGMVLCHKIVGMVTFNFTVIGWEWNKWNETFYRKQRINSNYKGRFNFKRFEWIKKLFQRNFTWNLSFCSWKLRYSRPSCWIQLALRLLKPISRQSLGSDLSRTTSSFGMREDNQVATLRDVNGCYH